MWRDTHSRLVAAEKGLTECPWLRPWAEEWTAAHVVLAEQQLVARFCNPRALAEAAAVTSLPQPLLTPETAFDIFGPDATSVLLRTWRTWRTGARWDAKPLVEAALSAQLAFHEAVGRRRKGRDEAEQSLERLTEAWAEQAREAAARASVGKPWRLIGVEIPPTGAYTHGAGTHEVLTTWESAVLAVYQIAVDWRRSTAALWVPQGICEQLLAEEGAMGATDLLREAQDWAAPASALLMAWDPNGSAGTARWLVETSSCLWPQKDKRPPGRRALVSHAMETAGHGVVQRVKRDPRRPSSRVYPAESDMDLAAGSRTRPLRLGSR